VIEAAEKESFYFKLLKRSNSDSTLLSYYEDSDHYLSHEDNSEITIITYYWKTPKQFRGGTLTFTDHNYVVELEPWDVIIFPSFMNHEVSKVEMLPGIEKNKLNGRVALSTFVTKRG
jgi:Rps23 Pro-64 3,4-dihydroxylase Tpa1-like proline 4-hydroxylase